VLPLIEIGREKQVPAITDESHSRLAADGSCQAHRLPGRIRLHRDLRTAAMIPPGGDRLAGREVPGR
jgi:hypothetical protein